MRLVVRTPADVAKLDSHLNQRIWGLSAANERFGVKSSDLAIPALFPALTVHVDQSPRTVAQRLVLTGETGVSLMTYDDTSLMEEFFPLRVHLPAKSTPSSRFSGVGSRRCCRHGGGASMSPPSASSRSLVMLVRVQSRRGGPPSVGARAAIGPRIPTTRTGAILLITRAVSHVLTVRVVCVPRLTVSSQAVLFLYGISAAHCAVRAGRRKELP